MKRVYLADSLVDAQLVADWLGGNGIPCALFNQHASGALGELPVSGPEIWVRRDSDVERAEQLIDNTIFNESGGERRCTHCSETSPGAFDICWHCQSAF